MASKYNFETKSTPYGDSFSVKGASGGFPVAMYASVIIFTDLRPVEPLLNDSLNVL